MDTRNTRDTQVGEVGEHAAVMQRLRTGFRSGKTLSYAWRRAQLQAIIRLLDENKDAICGALKKDLNKNPTEAWISDVAAVRKEAQYAIKNLKRWMKPVSVSTPLLAQPGKSWLQPQPLGVVLDMTAWNFPFHQTLVPMIGALAAGNCVVVKPSELCEHSAKLIGELLPRYFEADTVAVVQGGPEETQALLRQRFDHILYTGSGRVGRLVMAAAAEHLTPVTLELGGKSPCIVDKSADLKSAARRIIWGKWQNAGQICIAPDFLMVHESVKAPFLEALKAELIKAFGDKPEASPDYGRIINERHFDRLLGYLQEGRIVHGGQAIREQKFIAPTIVEGLPADAALLSEEIFGPIFPVISYKTAEDVLDYVNARDKPLALYVFSLDKNFQNTIVDGTSSGNVCINDVMMFMVVPGLPFGGVGASGMGSYTGDQGFETFTHFKPILRRGLAMDLDARYAPYNEGKAKVLRLAWK